MRKAKVKIHGNDAGVLAEEMDGTFSFSYPSNYNGPPISLTMPITQSVYLFKDFPPFFDGLLPEGIQLEGLLKNRKLDRNDNLGQLLTTGQDLVGAVTVHELSNGE